MSLDNNFSDFTEVYNGIDDFLRDNYYFNNIVANIFYSYNIDNDYGINS